MMFNIELFDKWTDVIEKDIEIIQKWTATHQELLKLSAGIIGKYHYHYYHYYYYHYHYYHYHYYHYYNHYNNFYNLLLL